ncbi:MAG: methyltransferase [Nocardioidaceae bacterium]|nr:methyltransferase [Nocardioidaceae bacterium]
MTATDDTLHTTTPVQETIDFGGLTIAFDERILRPRAWTVAQSSWAAELMVPAPSGPVLELCSGAGHIGLASVASNDRELVCVDLDVTAVEYCLANARAAGLSDRVEVRFGRLEHVLEDAERFPVIIADPPWVPAADTGRFPEDPLVAIDGGDDGLDVARACLEIVERHLAPGGSAVLQIGTVHQMDELAHWAHRRGRVRATEHRSFGERGVLVRFNRTDGE